MKNILHLLLITLSFASIFCNKEDSKTPPVIKLKTGEIYVENDDIVAIGKPIVFGIEAVAGDEHITNLVVKKVLSDGTSITMLDSGLFEKQLITDKIFYQSIEETVVWKISVMDRNRLSDTIKVTVHKDPNSKFGGIYEYSSIKMGFQENTDYGHFLDPFTGKVYDNDTAQMNQEKIHVATYYYVSSDLPSPTLASPGEVYKDILVYYPFLSEWTIQNTTNWDISVDNNPVAVSDFDAAHNDSLLIVEYDDVWGKSKFKWATVGRVIPFQTANGKRGMVKVIETVNTETGYMVFDLKIQR